jgi:hypothetical protein
MLTPPRPIDRSPDLLNAEVAIVPRFGQDCLLTPQSPSIRCGPRVPRSQKRSPIRCLPLTRKQGNRTVGGCHLLHYHARILCWRALPTRHHEASAAYCLPRRPSHFHRHHGKRGRSAAGAFGHFRQMANHDRNGKLLLPGSASPRFFNENRQGG